MNCPDCGANLGEQTLQEDGCVRCGACGKLLECSAVETASFSLSPEVSVGTERFVFGEKLGEGSFGVVYRAHDRELLRFVAIKVPKQNQSGFNSELFLREARAASRLNHPNIVGVYDLIQRTEGPLIVSQLIDGLSLRAWIEARAPSIDQCCEICRKLCMAIHYAHEAGIIHRDIKPANIMVDKHGEPHVLDFGLSHSRHLATHTTAEKGHRIGTPAFMAPEQVRGDAERVDRTTDVYAIGTVLFQLLTKQLPFHGRSSELYELILLAPPPRPRSLNASIPLSLEAICLKSLEKEPADRYQTAHEMAEDLQRFQLSQRVQAYGKLDSRAIKGLVRRKFVAGAAATMGLGLAGSSWWGYRQYQLDHPVRRVQFDYTPSDAKAWFERIDPKTGMVTKSQRLPYQSGRPIDLAPGFYRVQFEFEGEPFYVYRTVPAENEEALHSLEGVPLAHLTWTLKDSVVLLPSIKLRRVADVSAEMSYLTGGTYRATEAIGSLKEATHKIEPFLIDRHEVSLTKFKQVLPEYVGNSSMGDDRVVAVEYDLAIAFAERVGKQIPTAWQLLWAMTNGGQTRFPWGDEVSDMDWPLTAQVGNWIDQSQADPPVVGLFSGPLEWADTPPPVLKQQISQALPDKMMVRAVLGGPLDYERNPMKLNSASQPIRFGFKTSMAYHAFIGFRCVRNVAQS